MFFTVDFYLDVIGLKVVQTIYQRYEVTDFVGFSGNPLQNVDIKPRTRNVKTPCSVNVYVIDAFRLSAQYVFKRFNRVKTAARRPHEIVAASRRNKTQCRVLYVRYAVKHFVESAVAAESDYFASVFGQRTRKLGRVTGFVCKVKRVGYVFTQAVLDDFPYVFKPATLSAFYVGNNVKHKNCSV